MKAAVVTAPQTVPTYADFPTPNAKDDELLITVRASALSQFTRGRASGEHNSATGAFPLIAGADGVGTTPALRASGLQLMGSGVGGLGRRQLLQSIQNIFDIAPAANLKIDTKTVPLAQVAQTWKEAAGKPRLVYTIP